MFTVSYSLLQRYEYFLNYRLTIQYFRLTERVLLVVFPVEGTLLGGGVCGGSRDLERFSLGERTL
jgi:hypothetical protein